MPSADTFARVHSHQWLSDLALQLELGQTQVLVTVVHTQGSTPRDTGARMWVGADFVVDTIGGGHLEWKAMADARQMLEQPGVQRKIERYPLGPGLGQCCGGVVWLLFEPLGHDDASWCTQIAATLEQGGHVVRTVAVSPPPADDSPPRVPSPVTLQHMGHGALPESITHLDKDAATVTDVWTAPTAHVVVCGAGHIGNAIVKVLVNLPVQVIWLDPRDNCWPSSVPPNVRVVQGDADDVSDMPENAYWLILTHNHALDLAIIDAVFRKKTFSFLGLIGSKSKKARFVTQLSRRHTPELVQQICCPIGVVQTSSKLPSVIAVSIVAQLLNLMTT